MIVQIYEIQTQAEAEAMIRLGVDHIGSVILKPCPETMSQLKQTITAVQAAGRKSSLIPLFKDVDLISQVVDSLRPDILHLCETLPLCGQNQEDATAAVHRQTTLRERFPDIELMRSIPIAQQGRGHLSATLRLSVLFEPISDWFLTDTLLVSDEGETEAAQPVQGYIGITGQTCDWSVAAALVQHSRVPVILAGGIGPQNVTAGIRQVGPAGVDSCTLTNAVDASRQPIRFKKDYEKVEAMVEAARRCHCRDDLFETPPRRIAPI